MAPKKAPVAAPAKPSKAELERDRAFLEDEFDDPADGATGIVDSKEHAPWVKVYEFRDEVWQFSRWWPSKAAFEAAAAAEGRMAPPAVPAAPVAAEDDEEESSDSEESDEEEKPVPKKAPAKKKAAKAAFDFAELEAVLATLKGAKKNAVAKQAAEQLEGFLEKHKQPAKRATSGYQKFISKQMGLLKAEGAAPGRELMKRAVAAYNEAKGRGLKVNSDGEMVAADEE